MGLFDFFKKKHIDSEKAAVSDTLDIVKITIETPKPNPAKSYEGELENIRAYFGKLYANAVKGTENRFTYNTLHITVPTGVYYGYTKYTGETNRNGVKAVGLYLPDDTKLCDLDRKLWKKYDTEAGTDGLKWIGYSDGASVRITVYKDKILEGNVTSFLSNVGEWINTVEFTNTISQRAKRLNLFEGDFTYNKKPTQYGYDFYYNERYQIAGLDKYVAAPFVSFGYAKPEPENKFNSKAIAIYTDNNEKVGYISEKELSKFYADTVITDFIPLVIEAHYYNGKLYGWLYTFSNNVAEYHYMTNQFIKLLEDKY